MSSRRAIVTGGSQGIGEAIVAELLAAGAEVAVLDLQAPPQREGSFYVECDLRDEGSVVSSISAAVERMGGIDACFANAGIGGLCPIVEMSAELWDEMHAVNLRGAFLTLREAARAMDATGAGGAIVATGSVSGFLADKHMAHYNSSKAGLAMLCRIAAAELGPKGIRVNLIAPGVTDTPLFATTDETLPGYRAAIEERTPLGRLGRCEEVARAAVALADLEWVTGEVLVADGGVSLRSPIEFTEFIPGEPGGSG